MGGDSGVCVRSTSRTRVHCSHRQDLPRRYRIPRYKDRLSDAQLLDDLRRVARRLKRPTVAFLEYRTLGKYAPRTLQHRFGTWNAALRRAGLCVRASQCHRTELLLNLKRVWDALGRAPTKADMRPPLSAFSNHPYQRVFGGWRKGILAFTAWVHGREAQRMLADHRERVRQHMRDVRRHGDHRLVAHTNFRFDLRKPATKRRDRRERAIAAGLAARACSARAHADRLALLAMAGWRRGRISLGASPDAAMHAARRAMRRRHALRRKLTAVTRLRVLQRDGFRCVLCGHSPATDRRIRLHLDHIQPLARGGSNALSNLQTLCQECNVGKGAKAL